MGATGGSGTRVVARILREGGLFTGGVLNESGDAWKLGDYSDRWINVYLLAGGAPPPEVEQLMLADLSDVLFDHCAPVAGAGAPWGWKEPRSIYLLPFLRRHLPELRFLHVVRDGRDMALSANQNQLRKHGPAAGILPGAPEALRSIALWSRVNLDAARLGREALGERYLRVRFEDVCADPGETAKHVLGWAGLAGDASAAVEAVEPPPSLGRWHEADAAVVAELESVGRDALRELGYE